MLLFNLPCELSRQFFSMGLVITSALDFLRLGAWVFIFYYRIPDCFLINIAVALFCHRLFLPL